MELELRLSVEDSPNSAGIVIDAIRCCKLALDRGEAGVLYPVAAYFMKHPPRQYSDDEAFLLTEAFIQGSYEKRPKEVPGYRLLGRMVAMGEGLDTDILPSGG